MGQHLVINKSNKQFLSLFLTSILGIILGIIISALNTRLLGPKNYGDFKFFQTVFELTTVLFCFGFFNSGALLIAKKENTLINSQIKGALIIIACILSICLMFLIYCFSFFEGFFLKNNTGTLFQMFCFSAFIYIFRTCLENIYQGDNQIYSLSFFRIIPRILILLSIISCTFFFKEFTTVMILSLELFVGIVTIIIFIYFLNFSINDLKRTTTLILNKNKSYGFSVYIGSIANVASGHIGILSIAYFLDNTNFGFYSLSATIASPLAIIPNVIGTSMFKKFASLKIIPPKVNILTMIITIFSLLFFNLLIKEIVVLLYSNKYLPIVKLTYFISTGFALHGLGDFYNRYLGSQGHGKTLMSAAVCQGIWNIIGYTAMVSNFGVLGASIAKGISGAIYFVILFFSYKKKTSSVYINI